MPPTMLPNTIVDTLGVIAHADWSLRPAKRKLCVASRTASGWTVEAPCLVHSVASPHALPDALQARAGAGRVVFLGLDAAMGLPTAWGQRAGVHDFVDFLTHTVHQPGWQDFWHPAETPDQIGLKRPFYPRRPGGTRQHHLVDGLRLHHAHDLRRQCDHPRPGSPTPCPLFWTLGANQVGKATLTAWRELVLPALQDPSRTVSIWPFAGPLAECMHAELTLAEVYPGEVAAWLALDLVARGGKRRQAARKAQSATLLDTLASVGAQPTSALIALIKDGFGESASGEDAFDALLGVLGMLLCVHGRRTVWEPDTPQLVQLEGWVFGRAAPPPAAVD